MITSPDEKGGGFYVREIIPTDIVSCMSAGREPSREELLRVAERIRGDCRGQSSAFSWGEPPEIVSLRAAQAALCGTQ